MTQWEYRIVLAGADLADELNDLGEQGFEVCAAFAPPDETLMPKIILKRPKQD